VPLLGRIKLAVPCRRRRFQDLPEATHQGVLYVYGVLLTSLPDEAPTIRAAFPGTRRVAYPKTRSRRST